jgi:hypothetical protein
MNKLYQELHTNPPPQNEFINGINNLLRQNPQLKSFINMVKNGSNPKQMFFELAKHKGVDPSSILNLFK